MKDDKKIIVKKWLSFFVFAVLIVLIYKVLDNFSDISNFIANLSKILMPFIIGIIISYLLYIPASKIEKIFIKIFKNKARLLSIIVVYLIAIILLIVVFNFILPVVTQSIVDLVNNFQSYYGIAIEKINNLPDDSIFKSDYCIFVIDQIKNIDLKNYINIDSLTQYAKGAINMASGVFDFFVAIIVSFYVLLERGKIVRFIKRFSRAIFEESLCTNINKYIDRTNDIFLKFLASQILDAIVVFILTSVAMSIMGVKYAVLLGFLIGLFNLIPYFGAIIAVVISILITFLTGGIYQAIWMTVVVIILQQIDANIINPKIVGESLKISPLLVIFAVTIGGAYFGILGMFLAVPTIAVIKIILMDFINYRNLEKDKKLVIKEESGGKNEK